MPDLSNLLDPNSHALPSSLPPPDPPKEGSQRPDMLFEVAVLPAPVWIEKRSASDGKSGGGGLPASLEEHVRLWTEKKMAAGLPERECALPFLTHAPKLIECCMCGRAVYSGDEIHCSIRSCQQAFHVTCVMPNPRFLNFKSFKCSQHSCIKCKQSGYWRCLRCTVAAHKKCAPWPYKVIYFPGLPGKAVCWRHSANWRLETKHADPARDVEEIFHRLPLPYVDEEFKGDFMKDHIVDETVPSPYVHIRRNVYLVKRKRDYANADIGCKNCHNKRCSEDCVCRVQSISCSKACNCSDTCTNRPFRREKKVRVVKTKFCGWGVEAAETINKGEFVIEYIGEVIDDALCEKRLWDMKYRGAKKFYMCEIRKDFTIDATFKGNASRFLNHSCDPNCKLEKWQVDGETRVGVFASRLVNVGESLTYDYRFVQFGSTVACRCGAKNCQGFLGAKKKVDRVDLTSWGRKRKRSGTIIDPVPNSNDITCIHIPNSRQRVGLLP